MGKGQKQHYVPEVYLNNFSFDEVGNLYSIKIKNNFNRLRIKQINKSSVCYNPDNYRFIDPRGRSEKVQNDSNYIENNLFEYENNFIGSISRKINERKDINLLEAEDLIRTLLSIKNRNLHLKKIFQGSLSVKVQLKKEIEKLEKSTLRYKIQDPEKYAKIISLINDELKNRIEDASVMSDLYNDQILKVEERENINHEWLIKEICKSRFLVCCTTDSNPFLTSDNPGFTVHEGDIIGNLFFGSAKYFAFPISKTRLFVVNPEDRDGNDLIVKKIKYVEASNVLLRLSNKATILNTEERIFSNSREYLESLMSGFDFKTKEYRT